MNPDDVVDSSRKMSAPDLQTLTVIDRQKTYDPNHYQDDMVSI